MSDLTTKLKESLPDEKKLLSKLTINRFILKNYLVLIKSLRKLFISDKNVRKRLEFAPENLPNIEFLKKCTIWSDETMVRKCPQKNDIFFRCFSNTDRENLPLNYQFQCGGFSVMFWRCFSSFGLGPLVALGGSLNQWGYIDLLRDFLIPEIEAAKSLYSPGKNLSDFWTSLIIRCICIKLHI